MSERTASFGDLLRQLRSAAALSQEDLAERAGLSRHGISDLERGARLVPRLETVRLLADGLGSGQTPIARRCSPRHARPSWRPAPRSRHPSPQAPCRPR